MPGVLPDRGGDGCAYMGLRPSWPAGSGPLPFALGLCHEGRLFRVRRRGYPSFSVLYTGLETLSVQLEEEEGREGRRGRRSSLRSVPVQGGDMEVGRR